MTEAEQRQAVVDAGRRWIGTPHVHHARVLGHGIDCALFMNEAFREPGLVGLIEPGHYTHDWHLHRSEEIYLSHVEAHARRLDDSEESLDQRLARDPSFRMDTADIIMLRCGRTFSHGMIVTSWPRIIHAYYPSRQVEEDSVLGTPMMTYPARMYSHWGVTQ